MKPNLIISDILKNSWKAVQSQIWVLIGLFIGYCILSIILSLFSLPAQNSLPGIIIVNLVSIIISCLFYLGYTKNLFQTIDHIEPQFSAYGQQSKNIIIYFIASLIYAIIVLIGSLFLIIPGIYLALRFQFFLAFIVEENAGITESLKRSWMITKEHSMQLFLLMLAMAGIILLGVIVFVIGIFVAIPVVYMMYCYTFRTLNTVQTEDIH